MRALSMTGDEIRGFVAASLSRSVAMSVGEHSRSRPSASDQIDPTFSRAK
jgi:hypothetical protein